MISHHPEIALLLDYAAGALPEGLALAIATHASLCPDCTRQIAALDAVGGQLLATEDPVACSDDALANVLARLDEAEPAVTAEWSRAPEQASGPLPTPLIAYVGRDIDQLPWKRVGRLYEEAHLPLAGTDFKAALLRIAPGSVMPKHSHRGQEYALVLAGRYRDADEQFARGDFAAKDVGDVHQPRVDADGPCLCLVVQNAPVKLSGLIAKLIKPFLRG